MRFAKGHNILQEVQREIGDVLAHEHISLGKIQQWVQPKRNLFEALFSVSVSEDKKSQLWDLELSSQPHADVSFHIVKLFHNH